MTSLTQSRVRETSLGFHGGRARRKRMGEYRLEDHARHEHEGLSERCSRVFLAYQLSRCVVFQPYRGRVDIKLRGARDVGLPLLEHNVRAHVSGDGIRKRPE